MTSVKDLKQSALQSAAYDTILQVCLRVVSFVLNAVVVRTIGTATLAVCSVRLLLLYSTTLLLTREAFRRAALTAKQEQVNGELINLVWAGCLALVPVGCLLGYVWCHVMAPPPLEVVPVAVHYTWGVGLVLLCCALEMAAEVPYVLAELQLWSKTRVLIEGASQLMRSLLIVLVVTLAPRQYAVLGYCLAHLAGSCVYTVSYYAVFYAALQNNKQLTRLLPPGAGLRRLLPHWSPSSTSWMPAVDISLARVVRGFYLQCWLKELLTEGEWFLMNLLPLVTLTQQGTYQVVSNLGALGARLVFRSIEAAAYKFFGQTVVRGSALHLQDQVRVREAAQFLWWLLRGLALLGLTVLTFGWCYSHALLQLYGGDELSAAGASLLRAQCLLLVFLALNGVTEAYTFAAMSHSQLHRHSLLLVLFSLLYLVLCATLSHALGALGFVAANCVNMALRIAHGWVFIHRQYRESPHRPLSALLLPRSVLAAFAAAFCVTATSEVWLYPSSLLLHVCAGGATLLAMLYSLRLECRPLFTTALHALDQLLASGRTRGTKEGAADASDGGNPAGAADRADATDGADAQAGESAADEGRAADGRNDDNGDEGNSSGGGYHGSPQKGPLPAKREAPATGEGPAARDECHSFRSSLVSRVYRFLYKNDFIDRKTD